MAKVRNEIKDSEDEDDCVSAAQEPSEAAAEAVKPESNDVDEIERLEENAESQNTASS
jgi:hypothetical protein